MRSKLVLFVCVALALGLRCTQINAAGQGGQFVDPIFGLVFHTAQVAYEVTPEEVVRRCFASDENPYWTFSHVRGDGIDYFVVMAIPKNQSGDVFGTAVVLAGGQCRTEPSNQMLSGFVPAGGYRKPAEPTTLPGLGASPVCDAEPFTHCHYMLRSAAEESLLRAIVRDGLQRGIHARGSEAILRKVLCQSPNEGNALYPVVEQEVKQFCR